MGKEKDENDLCALCAPTFTDITVAIGNTEENDKNLGEETNELGTILAEIDLDWFWNSDNWLMYAVITFNIWMYDNAFRCV